MASKRKSNPINIAPFVDVLLVIFVILVVAARFDGPGKDELQKLNMLIADQKNKIAMLSEKKVEKLALPMAPKVKEKIVAAPAATKIVVEKVEDTEKIDALNGRISELEAVLEKAKKSASESVQLGKSGGGSGANILFGIEGKITVNGEPVSEDFVYSLIKTIHPDIKVSWKGRGHEAAYKFEEYAKSIGYEF